MVNNRRITWNIHLSETNPWRVFFGTTNKAKSLFVCGRNCLCFSRGFEFSKTSVVWWWWKTLNRRFFRIFLKNSWYKKLNTFLELISMIFPKLYPKISYPIFMDWYKKPRYCFKKESRCKLFKNEEPSFWTSQPRIRG